MAPEKQMPPLSGWRLFDCEKTHGPRAGALYCLLAQAGHSLKVQENSWPTRWRAPLPAGAGGPFVKGARKPNGRVKK